MDVVKLGFNANAIALFLSEKYRIFKQLQRGETDAPNGFIFALLRINLPALRCNNVDFPLVKISNPYFTNTNQL